MVDAGENCYLHLLLSERSCGGLRFKGDLGSLTLPHEYIVLETSLHRLHWVSVESICILNNMVNLVICSSQ